MCGTFTICALPLFSVDHGFPLVTGSSLSYVGSWASGWTAPSLTASSVCSVLVGFSSSYEWTRASGWVMPSLLLIVLPSEVVPEAPGLFAFLGISWWMTFSVPNVSLTHSPAHGFCLLLSSGSMQGGGGCLHCLLHCTISHFLTSLPSEVSLLLDEMQPPGRGDYGHRSWIRHQSGALLPLLS